MKSQSSIIMPLSPVNHYKRLPENTQIQMMFRSFQKNQLNQSIQCFLNVSCLNNALLFTSLCFGGLSVLESLIGLNKKDIQLLQQQLNQFTWDQKIQSFILFQQNARKLGNIYSFYLEKIFTPFNEQKSHKIQQIFKDISNSTNFLYGVKIRFLSGQQKEFKRIYQSDEIQRINGTKYLIFHQIKGGTCNFGMVFYQISATNTFANLKSEKRNKKIEKTQIKIKNIQCVKENAQQQQKMLSNKQNKIQQKMRYKRDKKTLRCPCQLI